VPLQGNESGLLVDPLTGPRASEHRRHVVHGLRVRLGVRPREGALVIAPHRLHSDVVDDHDVVVAEEQCHAVGRVHGQPRDDPLRLRPLADRTERCRRPVDTTRQARDLAALTEGEPDRLLLAVRPGQRLPGDDPGNDPRHLVQRQDEVGSGLGGSLRHRRLICGVLALRDDQPTRLLDRPHSHCRVPAHAGEHDRERPSAEGVGDGAQHRVVRELAGPALGVVQPARAVGEELDPLPRWRGDHPARA
jgi:hypothetical protein